MFASVCQRAAIPVAATPILAACKPLPETFFYQRIKCWPVALPLSAVKGGDVLLNEAACVLCHSLSSLSSVGIIYCPGAAMRGWVLVSQLEKGHCLG